jgi:predicted peptidase
MKELYFLLVLAVVVLLCGCADDKVVSEPGLQAMSFNKSIKKDISLNYWLYLPAEYGKAEKEWPLMLFLHGAGERGDDLDKVNVHGVAKLAAEGKELPFIVISPQCPSDGWWPNIADELVEFIDDIIDNYDVDESRLYVTGLSMGGYGTWSLIEKYPDKFAAAAPVCGGGDDAIAFHRLKKLPIWVFHGAKDNVVPVEKSQKMVDAIKRAGNKNIKFTIYPEAGHDSWTETYNNPELYEWFLEQSVSQN